MENVKIISENAVDINVNGLFYIFNSKYYFIYTTGELDEKNYVKLYVVQVCKEIKNTPSGTVDTGFMLGLEIKDTEEWKQVQSSITKIVEDKKEGTVNSEIQYLPISMLVNLKIVSKNSFKLMKHIVEDNFNVSVAPKEINDLVGINDSKDVKIQMIQSPQLDQSIVETQSIGSNQPTLLSLFENSSQVDGDETIETNNDSVNNSENILTTQIENNISVVKEDVGNDIVVDYRTKFFEEQQKNQNLEAEINALKEQIEQIKNIIG